MDQNGSLSTGQLDDVMDKLKILNFEQLLLKDLKQKAPHQLTFQKARNSGENFFLFASICAWLIRNLGKDFEQPQEYDDPSVIIANIMRMLKELDIPSDFASNKLIQGAGPVCVHVLDSLTAKVVRVSGLRMNTTEFEAEDEQALDPIGNETEVILEKVEEEQYVMASDDDDFEASTPWMNAKVQLLHPESAADSLGDQTNENWRLEVERVLPQLVVVIKSYPRDWRAHMEQMKGFSNQIAMAKDETDAQLKKLEVDVEKLMDKIDSREKHLNNKFQHYLATYKNVSVELKALLVEIEENKVEYLARDEELRHILSDLSLTKAQMEQKGSSMADGSPLINIKKAISKLNEEIVELDLKTGVLDHSLTQEIFQHNVQLSEMNPINA